jgi:hypothetical protein
MVLSALLTLLVWALASPPGSSPDDDYHLSSIWCAQGIKEGRCAADPDPALRQVPPQVLGAQCNATDPAASAQCLYDYPDELVPETPTNRTNATLGYYPPVFYFVMSLFVTDGLNSSIVLMRVVNSVLALSVLAALGWLLPRRLRSLAWVPMVVTCVPLGLFVLASNNPSSWALVSAATLWLSLYAAGESAGRRRRLLLGLGLLSALLGSGARGDACLFCVVAVGLVLILRWGEWRAHRDVISVGVVASVISILLLLSATQSDLVAGGLPEVPAELSTLDLAVYNIKELPQLILGNFGFGILGRTGWLDTPFPALVVILALFSWIAVAFEGFRHVSRRKAFAVAAAGAAVVVYPLAVLVQTHVPVGQGFQPRYALPLLVMLTGLLLLPVDGRAARLSPHQVGALVIALAVAHSVALWTQLRRYVTGLEVNELNLDAGREWWWDLPISVNAVWVLGSVTFALAAALTLRSLAWALPEDSRLVVASPSVQP